MTMRSNNVWLALQTLSIICGVARVAEAALKRVDVHTHYVPPFYRQILSERGLQSGGSVIPAWNATYHLDAQDKYGVQTSILSISAPGLTFFKPQELVAKCETARRLNEYGYNLSLQYPGRFQFFATLPLPDVDAAVAEAVYALDELKASGVTLYANSNGMYLGNPALDPLMKVLDEMRAVAFVHPNSLPGDPDGEAGIPPFVLDFLLDTSRAATNLVVRNVTECYPNIKFLLAHSGGFIPFAAGRVSLSYSRILNFTREEVLRRLQTFYVDLGFTGTSQLPSVLDFISNDKILFGSDWPSEIEGLSYEEDILGAYPFTPQQRYDIYFGNAATLFGRLS